VQNRTLNAEKSNSLMMAHPHTNMRELEQKKIKYVFRGTPFFVY